MVDNEWSLVLTELCGCTPAVSIKLSKQSVVKQHLSGNLYAKFVEEENDVFVTLLKKRDWLYVGTFLTRKGYDAVNETYLDENLYPKFVTALEHRVIKSSYCLSFLSDRNLFMENLFEAYKESIVTALESGRYTKTKYSRSKANARRQS